MEHLRKYATKTQKTYLDAILEHGSNNKAAKALGVGRRSIDQSMKRLKAKAASQGLAPEHDMTKTVPDNFNVKGVSSYYGEDGELKGQWVKSDLKREDQAKIIKAFIEGLAEDLRNVHNPQPLNTYNLLDESLMSCYIIGDHHLGMMAHAATTGDSDYNIGVAEKRLAIAIDNLIARSPDAATGILVNVGDFLHANDTSNLTQSGNVLDVDGHFSRAFRSAGSLFRLIISKMLEKHERVIIMNSRGNHDRDSSLMLNIMLEALYDGDPRVSIIDNTSKFTSFVFGSNLIVTHHGDKITPQRIYEHVTRTLARDWGNTNHRFCWMGHIHHKSAKEIGGMVVESWNTLGSVDSWHADSGYGSDKSMSCVVLHKEHGEHIRYRVGVKELE